MFGVTNGNIMMKILLIISHWRKIVITVNYTSLSWQDNCLCAWVGRLALIFSPLSRHLEVQAGCKSKFAESNQGWGKWISALSYTNHFDTFLCSCVPSDLLFPKRFCWTWMVFFTQQPFLYSSLNTGLIQNICKKNPEVWQPQTDKKYMNTKLQLWAVKLLW